MEFISALCAGHCSPIRRRQYRGSGRSTSCQYRRRGCRTSSLAVAQPTTVPGKQTQCTLAGRLSTTRRDQIRRRAAPVQTVQSKRGNAFDLAGRRSGRTWLRHSRRT
eukprot:3195546-Rhodomonas_salina.1